MEQKTNTIKRAIQSLIQEMMDCVMNKVLYEDPFVADRHRAQKPLYAALVPDEIFKGSHFERRFVTPFGKIWEKLAFVAAEKGLGFAQNDYRIQGNIKEQRLQRIAEVLNRLEHATEKRAKVKPSWTDELNYILQGKGKEIPTVVICDVFAKNTQSGERFAFEIKAPLPNSDQTKVSKEKLLKLYSMEPMQVDCAYFALPYNPYGTRDKYTWSFPNRWFNMREDEAVLIGEEFWEKIGGKGTYQTFISAVNEIGLAYRERIYREFLGIEPPREQTDVL